METSFAVYVGVFRGPYPIILRIYIPDELKPCFITEKHIIKECSIVTRPCLKSIRKIQFFWDSRWILIPEKH
ncbi:hypothetical protein PGB90_007868 [Kerria lacca]